MTKPFINLVLVLFLLPGCTILSWPGEKLTHKAYRLGEDKAVESLDTTTPSHRNKKVGLAYLEFDDQGEAWCSPTKGAASQLDLTLEALRKEKGPLKVILFCHGWNNNARPGNGNGTLRKFKKTLQSMPSGPNEKIFGIYVSWRGQTLPFPIPIGIDVGTREATAARVAGAPLLTAIEAISTQIHRSNEKSRLIAIGHSFGAKILANIAANSFASQIGRIVGTGKGDQFTPIADTIILVNTAENAMIPRKLIRLMEDYKIKRQNDSGERDLPLVVAVSSSTDRLVKYGLPVWNSLSRNILGYPSKAGAVSSPDQATALNRAMSFDPNILSHSFEKTSQLCDCGEINPKNLAGLVIQNLKLGSQPPGEKGVVMKAAFLPSRKRASSPFIYHLRSTPQGKNPNRTPFWIMQAPPEIVDKHGDIWNINFIGLVSALEGMTRAPENPRVLRKRPETKLIAP